jgi:hypothetical protein
MDANKTCLECGNDEATEGQNMCLECLELTSTPVVYCGDCLYPVKEGCTCRD